MTRRFGGTRRGRLTGPDAPSPGSVADTTPEADPESVARSICLRQLTMGPRSRGQLADTLASRGVTPEVADQVLDRLTDVGLVDDAAFAEAWVRTRSRTKGLSRRALGSELRAKGVEDELVAAAVETLDPDEELATARALVARRLGLTRGLPYDARMRRLGGMLARKGYPAGLAMTVVREALAAEATDTADAADDADRGMADAEA